MNIIRWFRELADPAARCMRLGHNYGTEFRRGYVKPKTYLNVVDLVEQERTSCRCCGAPDPAAPDWQTVIRKGFTGYSWPGHMADTFDRDGEYWLETGWRYERARAA